MTPNLTSHSSFNSSASGHARSNTRIFWQQAGSGQQPWGDHPLNPHNWPMGRRYVITILLSSLSFNTLMASTMVAPTLPQISKDISITSNAEAQLVLSVYALAYAVGYFFWAPLSEVYGRKVILQIAGAWFCVWNMTCGFAPNKATITVGRLFSGAGGAASLAVSTGMMGEIWRPAQRGHSLAILSTVSLLGPAIGPILGAAIGERSINSWRWTFWSTTLFEAVLQLLLLCFLHESHRPTILRNIAKSELAPAADRSAEVKTSIAEVLLMALKRPFYLMLTQHTSQGLTLQAGVSFGTIYIVLSVISRAFNSVYGQSLMISSLNYLSFGIGMILGAQVCAAIMDSLYRRKCRRHFSARSDDKRSDTGRTESFTQAHVELRLWPFIPAILLMSAGLLILGWSLQTRAHRIVPNVGITLIGAGSQAATQCSNAYMIDTFSEIKFVARCTNNDSEDHTDAAARAADTSQAGTNWTASAMASIWAIKSLGGFAFPLFAVDMIQGLGWGWSCTLLALLNAAIGIPVAVVVLIFGESLRAKGQQRIQSSMDRGTI